MPARAVNSGVSILPSELEAGFQQLLFKWTVLGRKPTACSPWFFRCSQTTSFQLPRGGQGGDMEWPVSESRVFHDITSCSSSDHPILYLILSPLVRAVD